MIESTLHQVVACEDILVSSFLTRDTHYEVSKKGSRVKQEGTVLQHISKDRALIFFEPQNFIIYFFSETGKKTLQFTT